MEERENIRDVSHHFIATRGPTLRRWRRGRSGLMSSPRKRRRTLCAGAITLTASLYDMP